MMNLWGMITAAYSFSLERRPLLTEMTTSGVIWSLGDLASQHIESVQETNNGPSKKSNTKNQDRPRMKRKFNWKRNLHQAAYASIIWGPIAHKWYHLLEEVAQSIVPNHKPAYYMVATKLALEIFCLHPTSLLAYFTVMGKMSGDSNATIRDQLNTDFWPTLMLEISLWTPLDVVNFALVPVRHQLLVTNCGCFVESVALSSIKNNGIESVMQSFQTKKSSPKDDKKEKKKS